MDAQIGCSGEGGEEKSQRGERRNHQEQDGIGEEGVKVGYNEKDAGQDEGNDDGEEAGVPKVLRIKAGQDGGAKAKKEGKRKSCGREEADGGDGEESYVKKGRVHGVWESMKIDRLRYKKTDPLEYKKTDPLGRTLMRW
jgi:hypothetical protein